MSRESLIQTSFNAGVLSPRLYGRKDFTKYGSAVAELSNIIPITSGPATFRPGTRYVAGAYSDSKNVRLIKFKFSATQTYVLEVGDEQVRFIRNREVVTSDREIVNGDFSSALSTGWTTDDTGTGASAIVAGACQLASDGSSNQAAIQQELDYLGIAQYTITADVTGDALTVNVGTTAGAADIATGTLVVGTGSTFSFTPSTSEDTWFIEILNTASSSTATIDNIELSKPEYILSFPFTEARLFEFDYDQNADVVYFALGSTTVKPFTLQRFGHDKWKKVDMDFKDGPYLDENSTNVTLTSSHTSGNGRTLTASSSTFAATDVGRAVRLQHGTSTKTIGWAVITAYSSPKSVTINIKADFGAATATKVWRLGAFSGTTGYPARVSFHEGRIVFANTEDNPNFVWMSEAQGVGREVALFAPSETDATVTDSNSVYFPLTAGDVSTVYWLSSGESLAVGTQDGEWIIEPGDTAKGVTPDNTRATRRTTHGSLPNVPAVRIDGTVMFAKGTGNRLNRFVFNFAKDSYQATNISLLGEHLFEGKVIKEMTYVPEPFSTVWVLFTDGTLAALTFVDSEDVGGWSSHTIAGTENTLGYGYTGYAMGTLGGVYSAGSGFGVVRSVVSVPSEDLTYDELWMVVRRNIDGVTKQYLEVMEKPYFQGTQADAVYVDSAYVYDGASTFTISGLDHLEGQQVAIWAEGGDAGTAIVSGGAVSLDNEVSKAVVGLPYVGYLDTLNFDAPNKFQGTSLGQISRITEIVVRMYETSEFQIGRVGQSDKDLLTFALRDPSGPMDTAPALVSGIFPVDTLGDWGLDPRVRIRMKSPGPCTLTSILMGANIFEG